MSRHDLQQRLLRDYYAACFAAAGPTPAGVDWADAAGQHARFTALLSVLDADRAVPGPCSVLDVGCGFGDLLPVLHAQLAEVDYLGCDLSAPHLAVARGRYGPARFVQADAAALLRAARQAGTTWDYVLASGTLNLRLPRWERWAWNLVRAMWSVCRRGLAFNLLDRSVPRPPAVVTVSPAAWLARCRTLTPHAWSRHDYLPGDVTFYLPRTRE